MYSPCLWIPGVGTVPPDFLRGFNYSGYSQLAFDNFGVPHYTYFWAADDGFQYWTDVSTGADIQFQDGGNALWNFAQMNVRSQDPSMFELPPNLPKCPFSPTLAESNPFICLAIANRK
jgi:hypothetical protein